MGRGLVFKIAKQNRRGSSVFTIRVGGVGDVFSVETKKTPLFTSIQLPFFTSSLLPDRLFLLPA